MTTALTRYAHSAGSNVHAFLTRQLNVDYKEVRRIRSSQVLRLRLRLHNPNDLSRVLKSQDQLSLILGVENVLVQRHRGWVDVDIPLPSQYFKPVHIDRLPRKERGLWLTLGRKVDGDAVQLNMSSPHMPHFGVFAMTGCGKSVTERSWAYQLITQNKEDTLDMMIIDGKGVNTYQDFNGVDNLLHPIISDPEEGVAGLAYLAHELNTRKMTGKKGKDTVLLIDEVSELVSTNPIASDILTLLTTQGRELGIHVVMCTHYPTGDKLGSTTAKAQLAVRAVGKMSDASSAALASGIKGSGADRLVGKGDFVVVIGDVVRRIQMGYVDNEIHIPSSRISHRHINLDAYHPEEEIDDLMPDPKHVALSIVSGVGNNKLISLVRDKYGDGIGSGKANKVNYWGRAIREELENLGVYIPDSGSMVIRRKRR